MRTLCASSSGRYHALTSQARYEAALERSKEAHRRMIQSQRELRHEHSIVLQCLRHFVKCDFDLDNDSNKNAAADNAAE